MKFLTKLIIIIKVYKYFSFFMVTWRCRTLYWKESHYSSYEKESVWGHTPDTLFSVVETHSDNSYKCHLVHFMHYYNLYGLLSTSKQTGRKETGETERVYIKQDYKLI